MAKGPRKEEVKKGAPEWMTTYSDMMSLLMCLFILLYAMSDPNVEKMVQFSTALNRQESLIDLGSDGIMALMGAGILELPSVVIEDGEDGGKEGSEDSKTEGTGNDGEGGTTIVEDKPEYQEMQEKFEQMAERLQTYFEESNLQDSINLEVKEQSIVIRFAEGMMFDSGQAALKATSREALSMVATMLEEFPEGGVRIEGHTDNRPINTVAFPSNYHLASARAISVMMFLQERGIDPLRMQSIGYGDLYPVDTNDTPEGRANNRHVELIIMSQYYTTTGQQRN